MPKDLARILNSQQFHLFGALQSMASRTTASLANEYEEIEQATGLPISSGTEIRAHAPLSGRRNLPYFSACADTQGATIDYAIFGYEEERKNRGAQAPLLGWKLQRLGTGLITIGTETATLAMAALNTSTTLYRATTITFTADEVVTTKMSSLYETATGVYDSTNGNANEDGHAYITDLGDLAGLVFDFWDADATSVQIAAQIALGY